jgi:type VI secretion system protein ImpA
MAKTMTLNVASLVEPIAAEAPTGADPALHDGAYLALQQAIKGRVDYKSVGNDEVRIYHPPDWQAIYDQALDCASRTRDLRVCIMLMRAAASREGPAGLCAGIELLRETIDRFWDDLHPTLDTESSDPGEQAFRRVTVLAELADRSGILRDLRDMPILEARGIGCALSALTRSVSKGRLGAPPKEALMSTAARKTSGRTTADQDATVDPKS